MRLFELIIEDENVDEIFAISMVDNPAIEAYGTYFSKGEQHFAEVKEEEGLFMAPILIPNKKILRVDGKGTPYEVYFSPETIKRLSQMYLEKKYQDSVTIEHDAKVEGITLVESWIKESVKADKSKMYGLNVPAGSWLGTFKIDNEEMREKFKSGEVSAVSIEGIFEHLEKSSPNRIEAAKLWESYSDFMDKDVEELSEVEADLVIEKIKEAIFNKEHLEAQPSIPNSSYPGESSGSYISPELLVEEGELDVYGYETTHFYICPGALGTFKHLTEEMDIEDDSLKDMIKAAALIADAVFMIEKNVLESESASESQLKRAEVLVSMFKDIFRTVDERTGMKHDISYMDGHIEVIKKYL